MIHDAPLVDADRQEMEQVRALLRMRAPPGATIAERRSAFETITDRIACDHDVVVEYIAGVALSGLSFRPTNETCDGVILYFHGGAFAIGSPHAYRDLLARLSLAASAKVIGVEYLRVPDACWPHQSEQAFRAYRHLIDQGVSASSIALAGDSAGANLALALALQAKAADLPVPAAIGCISPYVDLTNSATSIIERASMDPFISPAGLNAIATAYLAGGNPADPQASPLFADFAGMPPMLVQVGELEVLLDDAVRLANTARAAGTPTELQIWRGMIHIWPYFAPVLTRGQAAIAEMGGFLRARLDGLPVETSSK